MDKYEKQARNLEVVQKKRYKNSSYNPHFYEREVEQDVIAMIEHNRQLSTTYQPENK